MIINGCGPKMGVVELALTHPSQEVGNYVDWIREG
jgi:hypothetical protein